MPVMSSSSVCTKVFTVKDEKIWLSDKSHEVSMSVETNEEKVLWCNKGT
jgi:hypothetical protein